LLLRRGTTEDAAGIVDRVYSARERALRRARLRRGGAEGREELGRAGGRPLEPERAAEALDRAAETRKRLDVSGPEGEAHPRGERIGDERGSGAPPLEREHRGQRRREPGRGGGREPPPVRAPRH